MCAAPPCSPARRRVEVERVGQVNVTPPRQRGPSCCLVALVLVLALVLVGIYVASQGIFLNLDINLPR